MRKVSAFDIEAAHRVIAEIGISGALMALAHTCENNHRNTIDSVSEQWSENQGIIQDASEEVSDTRQPNYDL